MHDDSDNNQGYEHMLDFQMSWVMRVAANLEVKKKNPNLYNRCRGILLKLIQKTHEDNVEVSEVHVWKQWKRIDVIAEVKVLCNGKEEKHVVVLEDKAYTMIHDDQLRRYEAIVNDEYDDKEEWKGLQKHFWVITFFGDYENKYPILRRMVETKDSNWNLISFETILEDITPTGNEQFDDFWIHNW